MRYQYEPFEYVTPPGIRAPEPSHPVVIVGAGPVGLACALELARFGVRSVVLDDNNVVSVGSRAICWSKRSLEILDRLGIGERCLEKGVTWQVGRTFHGDEEVFNFDLLPEDGHKMPAFVNLQQYYVEQYLVEAAQQSDLVDLRFKNKVSALENSEDGVVLSVETPEGLYALRCDYMVACDGARSPIRTMMGLDFEGELFEERFLIADIEMEADFPSERHFWFEPKFHDGQSALLHKQPDNIYRIDLQLGWDADPVEENTPEKIIPRIERMLGHSDFKLDWTSVYTFQCRRLEKFVHERVIFAGDSAHIVSPFGARGGNGGLQDVDALGWRLAELVKGNASEKVLADYDVERQFASDENIANSSRATRFMTPERGVERMFRDSVLALAAKADFARPLVNSGRLSRPCVYPSPCAEADHLPKGARPGTVAPDAPVKDGWLLNLLGNEVVLVAIGLEAPEGKGWTVLNLSPNKVLRERYMGDAQKALYLVRPDQVIAARWTSASHAEIMAAVETIWGRQS